MYGRLAIESLKNISPDLDSVRIMKEPQGINGWIVHMCYADDWHAEFLVDRGNSTDEEMQRQAESAIIKQLEHHRYILDHK